MGSLVKSPFSEVSATLEVLNHLGVNEEVFKKIRSDLNYAKRLANYIRSGVPKYEVHSISTIQKEEVGGSSRYENKADIPPTILWDPSKTKIVSNVEVHDLNGHGVKNTDNGFHLPKTVLQYLLDHQELIPSEWMDIKAPIFFMGTLEYNLLRDCRYIWGIELEENSGPSNKGIWSPVLDKFEYFSRYGTNRNAVIFMG